MARVATSVQSENSHPGPRADNNSVNVATRAACAPSVLDELVTAEEGDARFALPAPSPPRPDSVSSTTQGVAASETTPPGACVDAEGTSVDGGVGDSEAPLGQAVDPASSSSIGVWACSTHTTRYAARPGSSGRTWRA